MVWKSHSFGMEFFESFSRWLGPLGFYVSFLFIFISFIMSKSLEIIGLARKNGGRG